MFKVGDVVKVVSGDFKHLDIGTVTTISGIWEDQDYPIELTGHSECALGSELELI